MGILSKFFSKQDVELLQDLENRMIATLKKTQSTFIALVGISGKIKGLDIILIQDDKTQLEIKEIKKYNAKLVEYFIRYNTIQLISEDNFESLKFISYYFGEKTQITLFPIEGSNSMIITAQSNQPKKILKDLIKYSDLIRRLKAN